MPIRILSEDTINKIAAGEVVERPANAVKEIVENALDAGSTEITIEIEGAGRARIRVQDNGSGMSREDLALAVTRHATSKIASFTDLEGLHTLGFRGEALPSIAAVSRLRIQSRQRTEKSGWEIALAGGKIKESRAWAGAPGTIVEVTDLFYNTPARGKFLKSDTTERHRILRTIEEMALAWPGVLFRVTSEGRTSLTAPRAQSYRERITDVLGRDFAAALVPASVDHPALKITAFLTGPAASLPAKNDQYLFVNRRPVTPSRSLLRSIYEAYRELLPAGRHPGYVLYLEINPAEIDVNIHPTKREVRFSKERELHDLIYWSLRQALTASPASVPPSGAAGSAGTPGHAPGEPSSYEVRERSGLSFSASRILFEPPAAPAQQHPEFSGTLADESGFRVLGQIFHLYLIVQKDDEIFIVDQHAAAERIRYEKYRAEWEKKQIAIQPLLFPETLELPPSQAGLLRENLANLRSAGWEIEEFGPSAFRVTALPAVLGSSAEIRPMVNRILEALAEESRIPGAEKIERIIRAACRSSIKAGETVPEGEALTLVRNLFACSAPATCPHGRPTVYRLTRQDLEKYFKRA